MTLRPLLTLTALCILACGFTPQPCQAKPPAAKAASKGAAQAKAQAAPASAPAAAASTASGAEAETQGIEPVDYNPDDPEMIQAAEQARASLTHFFDITSTPGAQVNNVAVRVLLREGQQREFIWVMPFEAKDKGFEGTVNDIPRKLKKVVTGQKISFTRDDIVDWMYSDTHSGHLKGHFTTCVLLRKAPAEERAMLKSSYGLDCDGR
jgi:uncharacterized protein YegJ (DUF2314 family)